MAQLTPPPNPDSLRTDVDQLIGEFVPIDVEEESPPKRKFPQIKLPVNLAQGWIRHAFRPMLFGAVGLHGVLLFTPLTSSQQVKTKETADPVKVNRLSDKVLVKSMPKVKVTSAPKIASLPKVTTPASNPIAIKAPDPIKVEDKKPEDPKPDDKKPEDPKPTDKPPVPSPLPPTGSSDKGVDPATVDPKKATTKAEDASKLDQESQQFASIIVGLGATEDANGNKTGAEGDCATFETTMEDSYPFFCKVQPAPQGSSYVGTSDVDTVASSLKGQFTEKFAKKGEYGGGELYEAKIGNTVRYISLVKASSGVAVFLWEKSPAS